jgi:hypothetical protein
VALFVSHRTLARLTQLPRARGPWALDSGGFTELSLHGRWTTSPEQYAEAIVRYSWRVRELVFAAPQDMMCEPEVVHGGRLPNGIVAPGTGMTVDEHLERTVQSVLDLRALLAPHGLAGLVCPVIQGYEPEEYSRCAELYARAGIDLAAEPIVGLGSVCRRQDTDAIIDVAAGFVQDGIRLHGFGVSTRGLNRLAPLLASCDSMAWSLSARMEDRAISRDCDHRRCVTCPTYAMAWRQQLLDRLRTVRPLTPGAARRADDASRPAR